MQTRLHVPLRPDDRSSSEFLSKQPMVETALRLLARSLHLANAQHWGAWQLAVSIADLRAFGVPSTELMIPLKEGYIEHAHETTRPGATKRSFRRHAGLLITDRSCFILTQAGAAVAEKYCDASDLPTQQMMPALQPTTTLVRVDSPHLTPPEFTVLGRIATNAVPGRCLVEAVRLGRFAGETPGRVVS